MFIASAKRISRNWAAIFVSINLNTLDDFDPTRASIVYWDGRHDNWGAGTRSAPWSI
jgi:hypothetical protein